MKRQNIFAHSLHRRTHRWWAPILSMALLQGVAWAQSPLAIDLGTVAGEPGETIEVSVGLTVGDTPPASLILYILFDPDEVSPDTGYYKFAQPGQTSKSAVMAGPVVSAANKQIDAEIAPDGRQLGVVITGVSNDTLGSGSLFDMALTIGSGVARGTVIALRGSMASNAADASGTRSIPVTFTGGFITVGCEDTPAPQGLSATQNLADRVELSWNAIAAEGAEYRLYRASSADVDGAMPLGSWQTETSFTDTTAAPPMPSTLLGCLPASDNTVTPQYYYVRARTPDGCESPFAGPVVGFRDDGGAARVASANMLHGGDSLSLLGVVVVLVLLSSRAVARRRRA